MKNENLINLGGNREIRQPDLLQTIKQTDIIVTVLQPDWSKASCQVRTLKTY